LIQTPKEKMRSSKTRKSMARGEKTRGSKEARACAHSLQSSDCPDKKKKNVAGGRGGGNHTGAERKALCKRRDQRTSNLPGPGSEDGYKKSCTSEGKGYGGGVDSKNPVHTPAGGEKD